MHRPDILQVLSDARPKSVTIAVIASLKDFSAVLRSDETLVVTKVSKSVSQ